MPAFEKPRRDNGLRDDRCEEIGRANAGGEGCSGKSASHSGTESRAPLWNGPRLTAAFVAQVLGQVSTPETRDPRSAVAAYERNHIVRDGWVRDGWLLDGEI